MDHQRAIEIGRGFGVLPSTATRSDRCNEKRLPAHEPATGENIRYKRTSPDDWGHHTSMKSAARCVWLAAAWASFVGSVAV